MVRSLLFVWLVGVVAFFVLWALLATLVRRISEKRQTKNGEPSVPNPDEGATPPKASDF